MHEGDVLLSGWGGCGGRMNLAHNSMVVFISIREVLYARM